MSRRLSLGLGRGSARLSAAERLAPADAAAVGAVAVGEQRLDGNVQQLGQRLVDPRRGRVENGQLDGLPPDSAAAPDFGLAQAPLGQARIDPLHPGRGVLGDVCVGG